jgi:hypothetical protein
MSHKSDQRDLAILQAISGIADPASLGMQVEDNYFVREAMENRREAGYIVPEEYLPQTYTEREKDTWRRAKWLQELEAIRVNRPDTEYCGNESEDPMEKVRTEMKFVDVKLFEIVFNTKVNVKQSRKGEDEKWFTVITLGKDQDKVILVGTRKDGKGTYLLTDWPEYMKKDEPLLTQKTVIKV